MSRLPAWLKLMDFLLDTQCPSVSRPSSRAGVERPSSRTSSEAPRPPMSPAVDLTPLRNLLKFYGINIEHTKKESEFIKEAAKEVERFIAGKSTEFKVLEEKLSVQTEKIKNLQVKYDKLEESTKADLKQPKDFTLTNDQLRAMRARLMEVEKSAANVRVEQSKEITALRDSLKARDDQAQEKSKQILHLEAEVTKGCTKIAALEDTLRLYQLEDKENVKAKRNSGSSASSELVAKDTAKAKEVESWIISTMRETHEDEKKMLQQKNRESTRQLMETQNAYRDLMDTLTGKNETLEKINAEAGEEDEFYKVMMAEMKAMKTAYESKVTILKKELELTKAMSRRSLNQLKQQNEVQQSALTARTRLMNFKLKHPPVRSAKAN